MEDFVISADRLTIIIKTVKNKHINWLTVFIVVKKGILPDNAQTIKKAFIEKEDLVSGAAQLDTL